MEETRKRRIEMWKYQLPGYELKLIGELQKQQYSSLYCDTLLQSEDVSVPTHSCILAALSPYLSRALAADQPPLRVGQRRPLKLHIVGARTLLKLVGLFYSGRLEGEGAEELEEVMAAACKLGVGELVQEEGGGHGWRTGSGVREAGVQTEQVGTGADERRDRETQVEAGTLVDTETQTTDNEGGADAMQPDFLPDVLPSVTPRLASPPHPPLLPARSSTEETQLTAHTSPPPANAQRASAPNPDTTSPQVTATPCNRTSSFRTPARTLEPDGASTDDIAKPSPSPGVLKDDRVPGDHLRPLQSGSGDPECSVAEVSVTETQGKKRMQKKLMSRAGQREGGRTGRKKCLLKRGVLERKCLARLRHVDTQNSIKVKLRRKTRGQVWEVVNWRERVRIVPSPARVSLLAALKKSSQDMKCFDSPQSPILFQGSPPKPVTAQDTPLKPVPSQQTPLKPVLLQGSPLGPAFLTPPPDLPISPLAPPLSQPTYQPPPGTPIQHLTPHPAQVPQHGFPQPQQVEESEEEIEKMLEDIMMGLNILPPRVLQRNCDQHHLHRDARPPVCSCSCFPGRTGPRNCEERGTIGSATHCMCSHNYTTERDDTMAKGTAFHSITSSHFISTTSTTCTVTPELHVEPQPLNPHCCSTCHSPTACHPHHSPLCCSHGPTDLAKCDRAPCYSGALPCSSGHSRNQEEFQTRNFQNQSVAYDGGSNFVAVNSGLSLGPLQLDQAPPQSWGSLSYTRERDLDPGSWLASAAHSEVLLTTREPDCPLINGEISASPGNGRTLPRRADGEAIPCYRHAEKKRVIPQEKEPMMSTHGVPSPADTNAYEPQHTGLHFPGRFVAQHQGSGTRPSKPSPSHWEELFLPKRLSPIHSPELSLPPSPVKRFSKVPATPFSRVPQPSKLPKWLCPTMAKLQFPLGSMLHSTHCQGNQCTSEKEHLTEGWGKTASIRSDSRYAGKEESKKRIRKIVTDNSAMRMPEKPRAKTKKRDVDETWNYPRNVAMANLRRERAEQKQPENNDTTEPPLRKRRCSVPTQDEAVVKESPSVNSASLKRKHRTNPINGQVKIGLCSVSLSSNNILAREELGRFPFDAATLSSYSLDEEAKVRPKETKRLVEKTDNPEKVLRSRDGDVKSLPIICTRARRLSSVELHQEDKKPDISSETACISSSGLQTLDKADGLHRIPTPPPSLKRKRGRPRKIRPREDMLSTATGLVPLVDMATGSHKGEHFEHKKEKEDLKGQGPERERKDFADLFKSRPTLPELKTDLHNPSQQRGHPIDFKVQDPSNCSQLLPGISLESQLSGLPQHLSTEQSGETKSHKDQVTTPAVKLTTSKGQSPTVSLKKFKELLKHSHQKTRKSAKRKENEEIECGNEIDKRGEGKLPKPKKVDRNENVSSKVEGHEVSFQSVERNSPTGPIIVVEIHNQKNQAEANQPEEKDEGSKISTKYNSNSESKRKKNEDRINFENAENDMVRETVSRKDVKLAPLALLSMAKTMVAPQQTDERNKKVTGGVTKESKEEQTKSARGTNKMEEDQIKLDTKPKNVTVQEVEDRMGDGYLEMDVFKEADGVQVHQIFGYTETEEVSGDVQVEEVDVEKKESSMKAKDSTVYPDAEDPGVREVDQEFSTTPLIRRSPNDNIDLPQNVKIATVAPNAADWFLPTPLDLEPPNLTSSRRITAESTISWESEEEEVVEVDVLGCSPDIQPRVWEALLEQGSLELTEEDEEDLEEDEIDVTGEETG